MVLYRDILHRQIDSVAMESPSRPALADLFLARIDSLLFAKHEKYYPNLHCRYVDNTFAAFDDQNTIIKVLKL